MKNKSFKIGLIIIAFFILFFSLTIELMAQGVDAWTKQNSGIEKYIFNNSELQLTCCKSIMTYDSGPGPGGVLDFFAQGYKFAGATPRADSGLGFLMTVIIFESKKYIDDLLSKTDKDRVFIPFHTHSFFIDNRVLVSFKIDDPFRFSHEAKTYLNLLNSYRKRLNAKLLIPPDTNWSEVQYFEQIWPSELPRIRGTWEK